MPRLEPVVHETTTGATREMLDAVKSKFGMVPNLIATFAQSPATLKFFLSASQALSGSTLSAKIREQIDLVVSQENGCGYCLGAHTMAATHGHKLTNEQVLAARRGESTDPKTAAVLKFAHRLVTQRGDLTDAQFAEARTAGLTDAEIADTIAAVALKVFTNYFAIATDVVHDFPEAAPLAG